MDKKADGWSRHRGGKCPVQSGALVDVRQRDGRAIVGKFCDNIRWDHSFKRSSDVMAYRVSDAQPVQVSQEAIVSESFDVGKVPTAPTAKLSRALGQAADMCKEVSPFAWRDRIAELTTEIEAEESRHCQAIQGLESEREALISKLAAEGFSLIERKAEVVSAGAGAIDWNNFMNGDNVEILWSDNDCWKSRE